MADESKETESAKDEAEATSGEAKDAEAEAKGGGEAEESKGEDADDAEDEASDEGAEGESAADQEALARRVGRLSQESEEDRIAREEEERLVARRAKTKAKKGKKRGLEASASKRLSNIGNKPSVKKRAVATAVEADPLIEKTQQLSKWMQENTRFVGAVVGLALVAGIAFFGYTYLQKKKEGDASALLATAVADERGRIGDPAKEEEDSDKPKDPTPIFKTVADRREAALAKYHDVVAKYPGTGAAYLARLSEGSLLLDRHEPDKAIEAFNDVLGSPLAQADSEVKGRALEGIGFADELKSQAGDTEKWQDDAIKQFRALENTDVKGFKELGMYHQARVYEAKGDKDKAKELLKSLWERINKPGEGHPFPYLQIVAEDRLRALDPTALPPKPTGMMGNAPGGNKQLDEAQIKKLIEQLQKQAKEHPEGAPK